MPCELKAASWVKLIIELIIYSICNAIARRLLHRPGRGDC